MKTRYLRPLHPSGQQTTTLERGMPALRVPQALAELDQALAGKIPDKIISAARGLADAVRAGRSEQPPRTSKQHMAMNKRGEISLGRIRSLPISGCTTGAPNPERGELCADKVALSAPSPSEISKALKGIRPDLM
jgi:hypothetical protein